MAEMAILQEIDKCMKCRGCQVACQRVQGLTLPVGKAEKVEADDPMVVKCQSANDAPPYVRYSCWHCSNPPCVPACPLGAMKVDAATGGVYVDKTKCVPASCKQQCATNCRKGGYPKIGTNTPGTFAYKCNLCYDQPGGPACVSTCPAKALTYDTLANIRAKVAADFSGIGDVWIGEGHMFWARKSPGGGVVATFTPPTTDPYIEDHISPMFDKVLRSPAAAGLAAPVLLLGGLFALYQRKIKLAESDET